MFIRGRLAFATLVGVAMLTSCTQGPVPSPTASPTSAPTPSAPETTSAPAIVIESPAEGATVSVPFTVSGEANTFEATLTIDVVDEAGMVACVRQLTATAGSDTPGTWEGMLAFPPEVNDLRVMLRAYAHSAEDGSVIDLVEYAITIAPDRPPIFLTSPTCGQVYEPGGLVFLTGLAAVFEAALTVDVRDSSGATVVTVPLTADACCEHSNFSSSLTLPASLPPGLYDVVAYNVSAADGSLENEFPVQIEIRA
jgi:hypothetical protein